MAAKAFKLIKAWAPLIFDFFLTAFSFKGLGALLSSRPKSPHILQIASGSTYQGRCANNQPYKWAGVPILTLFIHDLKAQVATLYIA